MTSPPWSELPEELLAAIAKRLNAEPEILRFRGVCKSWRFSTSLKQSSPFPLKLPFPISTKDHVHPLRKGFFTLSQTFTYLIQPLERQDASPYQSLLIRVWRGSRGKYFILNPFSRNKIIGFPPKTFPKLLNLFDYKVTEVGRSYSMKFNDRSKSKIPPIFKVYRYPGNPQAQKEAEAATVKRVVVSQHLHKQQCLLFGIYNEDKLFSMRASDKKWNTLDDGNKSKYEDVAIFKGKCYAVDHSGNVTVLNSYLKVLETIPSPDDSLTTPCIARHNHLVESSGDLLFISGDLDPPLELQPDFPYVPYDNKTKTFRGRHEDTHHTLRFKVYRLNEENRKWNQVTLEDRSLFLGEDCRFSVMANDSAGCRRNCIYYDHNFIVDYWSYNHNAIRYNIEGLQRSQIGVYNLKDDIGGPIACFKGFSDIFWPPPAWLRPNIRATEKTDQPATEETDQSANLSESSSLSFLFKMETNFHLFC